MNDKKGILKFETIQLSTVFSGLERFVSLIDKAREDLLVKELIGVDAQGVGYGNISARVENKKFLITGSQTSGIRHMTKDNYTLVEDYCLDTNTVYFKGNINPSSESFTHALIYECCKALNFIVHIHSNFMWKNMINKFPSTGDKIHYGSTELALKIKDMFYKQQVENILVIGGHKDGLFFFDNNMKSVTDNILKYYNIFLSEVK